MQNLFNEGDYQSVLNRINTISPIAESTWGKMEVHQMIVHLKDQLDIALGHLAATAQGPYLFRTRIAKWAIIFILPWRKGKEKTPKEMDASVKGMVITDFESDKHLLIIRLHAFINADHFSPHPFFGKLKRKYWGRLAWKHIDHHLRQFGA